MDEGMRDRLGGWETAATTGRRWARMGEVPWRGEGRNRRRLAEAPLRGREADDRDGHATVWEAPLRGRGDSAGRLETAATGGRLVFNVGDGDLGSAVWTRFGSGEPGSTICGISMWIFRGGSWWW